MHNAMLAVPALAVSMVAAPARGQTVKEIDAAQDPRAKLQIARPLVKACNDVYDFNGPTDKDGQVDPVSGFKAKTYSVNGALFITFAGTELEKDFSVALLAEAINLKAAADKGGWRVALALFAFSAQMPDIPFPADVRTDIELAAGIVPYQFLQAVDFIKAHQKPNAAAVITGHSLGGALANYGVGVLGNGDAVTFNAPYLNTWLKSHRAPDNHARVRAFQTRTTDGGGLGADPISQWTSVWSWFGTDSIVQVIPVEVQRKEWTFHKIENFLIDDLTTKGALRWVAPKDGVVAEFGQAKSTTLPTGAAVIQVASGNANGRVPIVIIGTRQGYISGQYIKELDKLGSVRLGQITGDKVNLRAQATKESVSLTQLAKDLRVQILDAVRDPRDQSMWFKVQLLVIRGGATVPANTLTKDPSKVDWPPKPNPIG